MVETNYARKLDTSGRIMLPSKLREAFGLETGKEYKFFTCEENGRHFICIECPNAPESEIERAKKLLSANGFKIEDSPARC